MIIGKINNGIVIDHIKAGNSMKLYSILNLASVENTVAIIKNVKSNKMGKKDIIKIDELIDLNLDVIGYVDPGITINIIKNGTLDHKCHLELPDKVTDVIKCDNPRCITSTEQELPHIFKLTDRENGVYRCIYCETKAKKQ